MVSKMIRILEQLRQTAAARAAALEKLLKESGLDDDAIAPLMVLRIDGPEPFDKGIPTLAKGVYRRPTPMIAARFEYAGRWIEPGLEWLSVADMEHAVADRTVQSSIESHRRHWVGSAPAVVPPERLTLYGIMGEAKEDQTYLVWQEDDSLEPEVWDYSGHNQNIHENIEKYIQWIIETGEKLS